MFFQGLTSSSHRAGLPQSLPHEGKGKGQTMGQNPYLYKVNQTYYFRVRIPKYLPRWFQREDLKPSLKTKVNQHANLAHLEVISASNIDPLPFNFPLYSHVVKSLLTHRSPMPILGQIWMPVDSFSFTSYSSGLRQFNSQPFPPVVNSILHCNVFALSGFGDLTST